MARLPRLYMPGCAQHVIQRGNNREVCFCDEADYKAYLSFLKDAANKYRFAIVEACIRHIAEESRALLATAAR